MSTGKPRIDVRKHPVAYITDYRPRNVDVNTSANSVHEDIGIQLMHFPDAANVAFSVELLNLTTSTKKPIFNIYSFPNDVDVEISISTSQENIMHQTFPKAYAHMTLLYRNRNRHIIGESIRIKYIGSYHSLISTLTLLEVIK